MLFYLISFVVMCCLVLLFYSGIGFGSMCCVLSMMLVMFVGLLLSIVLVLCVSVSVRLFVCLSVKYGMLSMVVFFWIFVELVSMVLVVVFSVRKLRYVSEWVMVMLVICRCVRLFIVNISVCVVGCR